MKIKYFDIHSHLHSDFFQDDVEPILKNMQEKGIGTISVGVNFSDSEKAVQLAQKNENIWAIIGIHPTEKEDFNEEKFQKLFNENKEKIIGVGECGLDYFWLNKDLESGKIGAANFAAQKENQKKLFIQQIKFAQKNNLPLMLHIRAYKNSDAYYDVFKILDERGPALSGEKLKINFHFFTETPDIAKKIIKKGWNISFPGVITFANLDETIKIIPLEKIMSETDSPFAAPIPYRGKTNTPIYVSEIVKKIAEVKKIPLEKCQQQLLKNTQEFFNLKLI